MIHCAIGLPRSGKSTLAKAYKRAGRVIVNGDQIRLRLYGQRYFSGGEDFVHSIKYLMIKVLLDGGNEVFIDETHTSEESIRRVLAIQEEFNEKVEWLFCVTSPSECKRRAVECGQNDLVKVIDRMVENLIKLSKSDIGDMKVTLFHNGEYTKAKFRDGVNQMLRD